MRNSNALGFRLTPVIILILLNLVFFLIVRFGPDEIGTFLALMRDNVGDQPWALVTSMFLYGDFWHYLANMIPLFILGNLLSREIGDRRFLIVYFAGGLAGNVLYFLLSLVLPASFATMILLGASGPIIAIGAVLIILAGRTPIRLLLMPADIPLYILVLVFFLLLSLNRLSSWEAHLGGLLLGVGIGFFFRQRRRSWRW